MQQSFSIYHDLFIHSTLSAVFRAVSDPKELVRWWPLECSGIPQKGEVYRFYFGPEYDWYGEVTQLEQDHSFYIKMTRSDKDWNPTTFGFTFVQQGDSVWVQFSHTGWEACNAHFRRTSYCWANLLRGLKNYVEKGEIVPFEARE